MSAFWLLMAVLAAAGGLAWRARLSGARAARPDELSDDMIRGIEEHGAVDIEEPLDLDEIRAEEERFWESESWEESDEY